MPRIKQIVWGASFKRAFKKRVMGEQWESGFKEKLTMLRRQDGAQAFKDSMASK